VGRRSRLVGEQQRWITGHRAGDRDALTFPAGQVVRFVTTIGSRSR
jgi:hypothetical protein